MEKSQLSLIRPSKKYEKDFRSMIAEFRALGEMNIESIFETAGCEMDEYIKRIRAAERGQSLAENFVPFTTFWTVLDQRRIVGISHLRHRLTPDLEIEGGHIGYSIRPSERRKGYGTLQLSMILEECRQMGLSRVMITCDSDNIGSYKIIEANGGILTGNAISPKSSKKVNHYWITL